MTDLVQKTAVFLKSHARENIAIGVSGGRDSSCLLHAVVACGAIPLERIIAVHVNHGLRKEADGDEEFVKNMCGDLGVKFRSYRIDVRGESAAKGIGLEQAARNMRYRLFYDLIRSREADRIMTAHHALDNAETVLMHLFRGSGLNGLRTMDSAEILRPFLDVYPDEIEEYAVHSGIKYVVDATNLIDDADRNFIRLNVIPLIEKRYRGAVRAVNSFSRECAEVCAFIDEATDETLITEDGGAVYVSDAALKTPLASSYVRRAVSRFSLTDVTREQIENAVGLIDARTGAVAELGNGLKAAREYGCVALYIPRPEYNGEKPLCRGANFIDGVAVDVLPFDGDPVSVRGSAADYGKIDGAVLRFRRDGDMFTPFGGKRKKLKQYFIDKKIPKRIRDRIPLVCRGSEVLAVVGVEISDSVKVTETTAERVVIYKR